MEIQRTSDVDYAYPITFMCDMLRVSHSGFFERRNRPEPATAKRREHLKFLIQKAVDDSDQIYRYRRVHAQRNG